MVFRDRQFPPCALVAGDSGIQVRGLPFYAGKREASPPSAPVLTMSGVESLGAWDTEHLATCGTFQHSKDLPRSKYQQHPHRETSINGSCSHTAVLEKQQANWHFPAAQPNMVKNWH